MESPSTKYIWADIIEEKLGAFKRRHFILCVCVCCFYFNGVRIKIGGKYTGIMF